MKHKSTYTILLAICVIGFWLFENFYTPDTYTNPEKDKSISKIDNYLLPSSTTNAIVAHDYFMLSYKEDFEQAEWVMYELKKNHLTYDDRKRPYFIEDPKVKSKSADWRNYKRSGYDRGHLCPAWNRLEQQVRQWCKKYGDLYVITGGVLENGLDEIGDEDVAVPNAFYKIVFRKEGSKIKVLAFLFPHEESQKSLASFLVSVDVIEEQTGIDFFHKQPKEHQDKIEGVVSKKDWKF